MTDIKRTPIWRKAIKITAWALMAIVLAFAALVMCVTNILKPEHLTRIAQHSVNKMLDADVSIGRINLKLSGRVPLLKLEVDSVTVISGPMKRLSAAEREGLPQWADTLLTLKKFEGGINIGALLLNKIDLYDVVFTEPAINLLALNDSVANYVIYSSETEAVEEDTETSLPKIAINRFAIEKPHPLRFHNMATGQHFDVRLSTVELTGEEEPSYKLDIGGDVATPELALYNLQNLNFGVNGHVAWDPESPTEVEFNNFLLHANFVDAKLNAHVDFGEQILVHDYDISLGKTNISEIMALVPDSLRQAYGITDDKFSTDCAISFDVRSRAPFNLSVDSVPNADFVLKIFPGQLRYQQAQFKEISGKVTAQLMGNQLNDAVFSLEQLKIAGPATALLFNVKAKEVMGDPLVWGTVEGNTRLEHLPRQLSKLLQGYARGNLKLDLDFKLRPSMLTPNEFHRLKVKGDLTAENVYYLSSDTANMLNIGNALLHFGTDTKVYNDTMLTARIMLDSVDYLHTQYSVKLRDFDLGLGVSNQVAKADTTKVLPMGGDLKFGRLYFTAIGDSIAVNATNSHGRISMQRFRNDPKRPQFTLSLDMGRFSTGSPDVRFLLTDANLDVRLVKGKERKMPRRIQSAFDSIRLAEPDLPMDSVYARAIRLYHDHKHHGRPRVHPEMEMDSTEILYWGTSKFLRKLLLDWRIRGHIGARRAGLYTPYFPLRNRMSDFELRFNNDSIILDNVNYKAGRSDFLLSGQITNIRRGFTSRGYMSPIKLNFEMLSDTIDINELANSTFRGSAYALQRASTGTGGMSFEGEGADDESRLNAVTDTASEAMAAFMVPKNIDANIGVRANHVLYSDLLLHDFSGELLASRGQLNLHELAATSDMGSVNLSALYSTPKIDDIRFGFGMDVKRFNIERFVRLMPALDSIMPMLKDFSGIVNGDIAATCRIDREMNLELPTLEAAMKISGDSLELIDPDTYKMIGKWLFFRQKNDNIIKHMSVELTVSDNQMRIYPFIFDLDRYKLGVQGHNDLDLNFDYHIAVLKSPIPFKFGVNVKGNPDKFKVRLGRARLNEKDAARSVAIVDTTRVNLIKQIEGVFRRGVDESNFAKLNIADTPTAAQIDLNADTISHADSLLLINEGLIPAPEPPAVPETQPAQDKDKKKSSKQKKSKPNSDAKKD